MSTRLIKINFDEHDPSRFLCWGEESTCVLDIKRRVVKQLSVGHPILFATFHSAVFPVSILTIEEDGTIYSQPWYGSSREFICKISLLSNPIMDLILSPTNNAVAIVQNGVLAIKEASKNGRELRRPGAYYTASWTLDAGLVSAVPFDPDHFFHAIKVHQKSRSQSHCSYHDILNLSHDYISSIGPYRDKFNCVRYGQCQLDCSRQQSQRHIISGDVIAWMDNDNHMVVVDMFLWANHVHSKLGFMDRIYPWRYNWPCQCQEFVQYHRKLDELRMECYELVLAEYIQILIDLTEFECRTRELKTHGSLQEVLDKLEVTGWGESIKCVDEIRLDTSIMYSLEELWRDENLTMIQELKCRIGKEFRKEINEALREFQSVSEEPHMCGEFDLLRFMCIYQLRVDNCDYRGDWERVYEEIQRRERGFRCQSSKEEEWSNWIKANTALDLSDEKIPNGETAWQRIQRCNLVKMNDPNGGI
ncbi:hypothetical protein CPB86DRAFT_821396 [Serendipita vermifera]|nr:hypothetical protein CPB86DRAFT_821396 [Serendipita vermifera]